LPRLEDLTVESNVAAFLRKGVPDALRNAALRKMWSLDPAIRDHVGLAECAWDFNQPESIPGFGSLTKAFTPAFLSQGPVAGSAAPDAAPSSLRRPGPEAKPAGARVSAYERETASPVREAAATDGGASFETEIARRPATCRHGSALPDSREAI
jgi:hypothetical protein